MGKYVILYGIKTDNEETMSVEELNEHLKTWVVKAENFCDAEIKFFEVHDRDDFKIYNTMCLYENDGSIF